MQDGGGIWQPVQGTPQLLQGLRTGTGRVTLGGPAGRVVVGSASRLRVYSGETDFQEGRFYLEGAVPAYTSGSHLQLSATGRARVDISPLSARLGVMSGTVRVASGAKTVLVAAGQQFDFKKAQVSPFSETDPWYAAQFTGAGDATVQALRGQVEVLSPNTGPQPAQIGDSLGENQSLRTRAGAWAELGFTGGGYLRLTEESELRVMAVEKTSQGREVTLQLLRGHVWNVVQKGQGGYRLNTPVVSTAVRGTRFRVDATGLVKVIEGQVELPSDDGANISSGEQKQQGQPKAALQLDDLDRFNSALDAQRALPQHLRFKGPLRQSQTPVLSVEARPDTVISVQAVPQGTGAVRVQMAATGDPATGKFELQSAQLPDGPYTLELTALRFGQQQHWSWPIVIDRTPPQLGGVKVTFRGRVMQVSGEASDSAPGNRPMQLLISNGELRAARQVRGQFRVILPAPPHPAASDLTLADSAGNVTHVHLP